MIDIGLHVCGDEGIEPVLDRRGGFFETARNNWEAIVDYMGGRDRVREPVMGNSREMLPLQAADLLAYETMEETWYRRTDYPVSYALRRLVAAGYHHARVLTLELSHGGRIKATNDTPYLYRRGMNIRSPLLWHGQFFRDARKGDTTKDHVGTFDNLGDPSS